MSSEKEMENKIENKESPLQGVHFAAPPPEESMMITMKDDVYQVGGHSSERLMATSMRMQNALRRSTMVMKKKGVRAAAKEAFHDLELDENNNLTKPNCVMFLSEAAKHVNLKVESEVLEAAVDALMDSLGCGDRGFITEEQFINLFDHNPDLQTVFEDIEMMSTRMILSRSEGRRCLTREEEKEQMMEDEQVWLHAQASWKNRHKAIFWIIMYVGANVAVFTTKALKYERRSEAQVIFGSCITVARGSAACLNLNCMLILLPMCRRFLTLLRVKGIFLHHLIPFDVSLEFHMIVAAAILIFSLTHVSAHICDFTRLVSAEDDKIKACFGDRLGNFPEYPQERLRHLFKSRSGITGLIMLSCLMIAYPLTLIRRKNFNTFWYAHHLLILMLIALCVHGTQNLLEPFQSVYWIMVPLFLYIVPRFWREIPSGVPHGSTFKVLDINVKKGNVLQLQMEKPKTWDLTLRAGMYIFINIPAVSRLEWHPFTLTSCPADDYIEINFRKVGDWTTKAHEYLKTIEKSYRSSNETSSNDKKENFEDNVHENNGCKELEKQNDESGSNDIEESFSDNARRNNDRYWPVSVRVEGPLGASSQGFEHFPVVVLVGAGIGITPMISVLKMLIKSKGGLTKRAFFYWTTRDPDHFTWFQSLMDEIYQSDPTHIVQTRHFLTSAKHDDRDLGAVLLNYATKSAHKKTNVDLVLGHYSHQQVEVGRPKWKNELLSVKREAQMLGEKKCGIFLCGPSRMADDIERNSKKISRTDPDFHMYFSKETF